MRTLQSRTFWVVVFMVLLAAVQSFQHFIGTDLYVAINSFLGALAIIFHVNPSQDYQNPPAA